ncbi:MAG: Glutathione S-transferase [Verrucomicrobiaceae bacterium]|nr:Glutathione S-transferase [Verrucomicrobiaceae bacterium]
MKLFYSTAACSLSPHIVLREAGVKFDLELVDLATHKTANGVDYTTINPKGYVPALLLDNGELLTEGPAIVQYIADQNPQTKLAPAAGTFERVRLQEMLNFISTELHKQFPPLFNPTSTEEDRAAAVEKVQSRLSLLDKQLGDGRSYLFGEQFSVADAYLFVIVNWTFFLKVSISNFPNIGAFYQRVAQRDKVKEALRAEGIG